jgi:signal transduction histidine kinase
MTHRGFREAVFALRRLNELLELEVKRIAHALHDEAGQLLVAVHLALADLDRDLPAPLRERLGRVNGLLDQVDEQLRRLSHELRPTVLDDLGLVPAIQFLAEGVSKRTNQAIFVHASLKGRLPAAVEIALYRIVQEALTNTAKHSRAKNVHIQVDRSDGLVRCSVCDDGGGFDVPTVLARKGDGSLGLLGMQERLHAVGGSLQIQSSPGRGTSLLIKIPLET